MAENNDVLVRKLIGKKITLADGTQTPVIIGASFTKNHLKIWFEDKFKGNRTLYL